MKMREERMICEWGEWECTTKRCGELAHADFCYTDFTLERRYHSGFNSGLHIGEAVNFALPSWISYGFLSLQRYRATGSMSCLDIERMLWEAVPRCLGDEDR